MARHGTRMRSTCEETSRRPGRNNKVVSSISRVEYAFRTRPPGRTKGEEEDEQGKKEKAKEKEEQIKGEKGGRETGRRLLLGDSRNGSRTIKEEGQGRCLAVWQLPPTWDEPAGRRTRELLPFHVLAHYVSVRSASTKVCVYAPPCAVYTRRMVSRCISEVGRWIGG